MHPWFVYHRKTFEILSNGIHMLTEAFKLQLEAYSPTTYISLASGKVSLFCDKA